MTIYQVLMIVLPVIVWSTKGYWLTSGFGSFVIIWFQTIYTFIMVAYLATSMNVCWKRIAATQFTLYMAIGNMGRAVGSSLLGPLREQLEWSGMFMAFGVMMAFALACVQWIHLPRHLDSLGRLETDHLAKKVPDFGGAHVPR